MTGLGGGWMGSGTGAAFLPVPSICLEEGPALSHPAMWGKMPPRTDWWGPQRGICQGVQEIAHLAGHKLEDRPAQRHVLCLP